MPPRMIEDRQDEIVRAFIAVCVKHLDPDRIILFGSRAKGDNAVHADFDFAVSGNGGSARQQRQVREEFDKVAGLYSYDIVYLDAIENDFRKIILQTGKVIYDK